MANVTIDQLTGKTALKTDQLEVQATVGGASNKVTVESAVNAQITDITPPANTTAFKITAPSNSGVDTTPILDKAGTVNSSAAGYIYDKTNLVVTTMANRAAIFDWQVNGVSVLRLEKYSVRYELVIGSTGAKVLRFGNNPVANYIYDSESGWELNVATRFIRFYYNDSNAWPSTWAVTNSGQWQRNDVPQTYGICLATTDVAVVTNTLLGQQAFPTAAANIVGGAVNILGGSGASSSAGAASGGSVNLNGGANFGSGNPGNIIVGATRGYLITAAKTFSTLASAAVAGVGARSFITDGAASPVFSAAAAGGGTLGTPVYSDGTTWRNG